MSRKQIVAAALFLAVAVAGAQPAAPAREPASKAAAILTWPSELRERYIAALDSFFLTRTVKAGPRAHRLDRGGSIAAFEAGGPRAEYVDRFIDVQRVRGVLVLHDGRIRFERYASPHGPSTRWNSFSVAKSITSTLVGAAMKDGYIKSLDDPVTRYIGDLRGSAYDEVTVRQLLTMTSGVKWNEDYTDVNSDVARMYAQPPDPGYDMTVSYVRKLPREAPPGTKWVYKTSETNLVGVLVAEATRKPLAHYLSEKIWRTYGMERDAEWMIDDVGHEQGGCCLAVTLRDYARFGQFILDGARVDGKPVVPDNWLAEATRTQVSTGAGSGYGYQWWTRDDGTFEGRGIYGQTLHIDRARRLVIVINSATEQPTGRAQGEARQEFIAAVKAELDAEGQVRAQSPGGRLFYLDIGGGGRVLSANVDGSDVVALSNSRAAGPDGIVVDEAARHLFWTTMGAVSANDGTIERADLDGSHGATMVAAGGTFTPKQIKLDPVHHKLYWADREGMRIMRANLDGSNVEALVETGQGDAARRDPRNWCVGIALDVARGQIYWTQKGTGGNGRIVRAGVEVPRGQTPATRSDLEVLFDGLPEPIDMDIDLSTRLIYWTDRGDPPRGNTVSRAPMDPPAEHDPLHRSDQQILFGGLKEGLGIALDLTHRRMFVTDLGGNVYSATLAGLDKKTILTGQGTLTGIAYAELR